MRRKSSGQPRLRSVTPTRCCKPDCAAGGLPPGVSVPMTEAAYETFVSPSLRLTEKLSDCGFLSGSVAHAIWIWSELVPPFAGFSRNAKK